MSGARLAWALACFCTSVAASAADAPPADPATLELGLARERQLYLVVEREHRSLSIRVRGMELDAVPLREVRAVWRDGKLGPDLLTGLARPQVWRVTEAPAGEWRRVVAPPVLVPFGDDHDRPPATGAGVLPSPTPPPPRPDSFAVATDSPWRLAVAPAVDAVVPVGWWRRVARGWRRVVGREQAPVPPTLVLVVADPEDARRVVHLFRPGMAVLVGGEAALATAQPRS